MINTRMIKSRMALLNFTQKDIAGKDCWDCALPTVSQKINGVRPITVKEADKLAIKLKCDNPKDYFTLFFNR